MRIERFKHNPIITASLDPRVGDNINGPSLIRVPEWVVNRLGNYYLYFAHHRGDFIRLAYANELGGPWTVFSAGTLTLEQSGCVDHIASPDVHVDARQQRIRMYYHGQVPSDSAGPGNLPSLPAVAQAVEGR